MPVRGFTLEGSGEARERYAKSKKLADQVRRATASLPAALKHIPMSYRTR